MDVLAIESAGAEERLGELIFEYVDALHAGREPDREDFLRTHPEFRRELEGFFAGHDCVERLAAPLRRVSGDSPHGKAEVSSPSAEPPALGHLGEFRLLREVGRGGMGVVYEAEQLSLQRRVALKVLPFATAIDDRRLQRFKNEALAAAHLRHENIVPVYSVGADLGVHYYAMQFIEGQSLAALIGDLRRFTSSAELPQILPSRSGSRAETAAARTASVAPETRAEDDAPAVSASISRELSSGSRRYYDWVAGLGRQAAEALEHAHQAGIVHRDVKPANLLLDPRGQLWVTDFGLAQVSGDAGLTMTGELLGTLRYASPEQARARSGMVDHRTDIYSLGTTLYELLTLRPIFEGRDRNELLRQIADDEPRLPRSINPSVPKDLETVVLKSLTKEPAERYATAQEMAADLQRFLDNRPILARRPTVAERLRKWGRRHPTLVIGGAAAFLLLFVGSLVNSVLIRAERRKVEQAYERERLRANEAEAQYLLARRSVDGLLRLSEDELAYNPAAQGLRRRLLTSVLSYYQEFIERRPNDPGAQEGLREASWRVEKILADLAVLRAVGQIGLLRQPAVLDDLRLDETQRERVRGLSIRAERQWKESLRNIGRVSATERERRSLEQAWENEADLKAALAPEQLQRLHEIGLQADVASAFREPEIAEALVLTDEQRDGIRTIEEERWLEWLKSHRPDWLPADGEKNPPATPKATTNERLLELLTAEQSRKWKELTGEPFRGLKRLAQ